MHMVAKLHYEADLAQVDIARKLNMSTATISRLLQRARLVGIVRIEVVDPASPDDIREELIKTLDLKAAAVVDSPGVGLIGALAQPVGAMLRDLNLAPGSVVGIGWGRAVREVVTAGLPRIPGVITAPLNGGMQQAAPHFQINEFVREAAEQMGGTPCFLHAPYLSTADLRDLFLTDPSVAETVALWDRLDVAIVGVGLPHILNSPEVSGATADERAIPGAVGDVIRHYYDASGTILPWDGAEGMIAASPEQLRRTPLSIGVAAGVDKVTGMVAAVRSGMINAIVTDTTTARAIVDRVTRGEI
jgi:DNA-binding transcriptional regulator LsrR (DeoR family)